MIMSPWTEGVVEEGYDHVPMDGYFQDNSDYA